MAKLGTPYQNLVASVVKAMDPASTVKVGKWIKGPDGLRELDVSVAGFVDGKPFFVLIECKDWRNPIGIGHVDALDSKRADVRADVTFLCSNSGFTEKALTKGARVGIHLVTALRRGDRRVKTVIQREIYLRRITLEQPIHINFVFADRFIESPIANFPPEQIIYDGKHVSNWFHNRLNLLLAQPKTISELTIELAFPSLLSFQFGKRQFPVLGMSIKIKCVTKWYSQVVRVNADAGIYDYIRKRPLLGATFRLHIENFSTDKNNWKPIDFIPSEEAVKVEFLHSSGEGHIQLHMVSGFWNRMPGEAPDFNRYITSEIVS